MIIRFSAPLLRKYGMKAARKVINYSARLLKHYKKNYTIRYGYGNSLVQIIKKKPKKGEDARIFSLDYHNLPLVTKKGKKLNKGRKVFHYHLKNPAVHYVFRWSIPKGY
ncbi:hypothetical protein HMPREF9374_3418, partial [Desmospora sp. 8437]